MEATYPTIESPGYISVKGIYLFKVKGGPNGAEGKWILDAKNGSGSVEWEGQGTNSNIYKITQSSPLSLVQECRDFALIGWILIIVMLCQLSYAIKTRQLKAPKALY